ncbi:alpha/beta hydrolase [Ensifer adhaerens]|nr:alpha/beta hydrolase [Ensifer adhaerens]UAY10207.1 alpha/beta hydrolase [Ensifer adhaerens]
MISPVPFGPYDLGNTTVYSARSDARFSYCLFVPSNFSSRSTAAELLVAVHGTPRTFMDFREMFADFAERNNVIVLSPLFPVGVNGDGNADGYKYIEEQGLRYDAVLLDIVGEVCARYGLANKRFALFGFSGGAQFANRFLLLRPDHLWAASIVAPGSVTLVDDARDWWVGTRDLEQRFGRTLDAEALRDVAVQLIVGDADLDTREITHKEGGRHWMPEANSAGRTRPERLAALRQSLDDAGVETEFHLLTGVGHTPFPSLDIAREFFVRRLGRLRR